MCFQSQILTLPHNVLIPPFLRVRLQNVNSWVYLQQSFFNVCYGMSYIENILVGASISLGSMCLSFHC